MSNQTPSLYRQEGDHIDYAPGNAAITGGDVVKIGNAVCIAKEDIPANGLGTVTRRGVFRCPKDNASAFNAMDQVFWNATGNPLGGINGAGAMSNNATNTTLAGRAYAAQLVGDATVDVILNGGVP